MKEKILTSNFCLLFISNFFCAIIMYMLMTTITEYATAWGASATIAGLISGIYVVGGLCSRLYSSGSLVRVGWKRMAIIFLTLHLIACSCYFFVHSIPALIIIRFIHGIGFGASMNATMTIAMSILPKSRYGEATGYFMLSTTLAVAAGPYLGGIVYDNFGAMGCFSAATIMSAIMLLCMIFVNIKDIDPRWQKRENTVIDNSSNGKGIEKLIQKSAIPASLCAFFLSLGFVSLMSFYRLYSAECHIEKEFSYFFLIYAAILIFSRPLAGKIQDKYGDNVVCIPGIILQTIGIIVLALHPCLLTIILCAIGCGFGYGTLNSALNAMACRGVSNERRSFAVTTYWLCCDLGMGIGPALLGAIIGASSFTTMYFVAAGITLFTLPVYFMLRKK